MRLRIGRDALADAVTWAARALPSRPVIPILAGLRLEASEGRLTLSCFDYEVSARCNAEAAVAEPGSALVSGRLLAEIARSLPPEPVDIASDGDSVTLSCGSARFTLLALPLEEFPALPPLPPSVGTVDSGDFATAVGQVAVAAGRDDTLPMLTGILVELDGSAMTLVATDRYRMAMRELAWQPALPDIRTTALVPARTLAEAAKSMSAGPNLMISLAGSDQAGRRVGDANREVADGLIGFDGGGRRLTTRLLGAEFVTYRSRFPHEFACRARLAPGRFSEAIRRVALVADRDSRLLLTFGSDEVVMETGSGDGSRAVENVEADFHGEEGFAIAFKPQYLLDGIGAAAAVLVRAGRGGQAERGGQAGRGAGVASGQGAEPAAGAVSRESAAGAEQQDDVTLQFTTPDKPAVITGGAGFRYLLAPMRT